MWGICPVCGESDMRIWPQGDRGQLIHCTNLACASNGGTNAERLQVNLPLRQNLHLQRILEAHGRYENAGHGPTSLQRLGELLEVIAQVELAQ